MRRKRRRLGCLLFALLIASTLALGGWALLRWAFSPATALTPPPQVRILQPEDGTQIRLRHPLPVQIGAQAAPGRVLRALVLQIDQQVVDRMVVEARPQAVTLVHWTPSRAGNTALVALAYDDLGQVAVARVRVVVSPASEDMDQDGLRSPADQCPDRAGPEDAAGCPVEIFPDRDRNHVPDAMDVCSDRAGPEESMGCPARPSPTDRDGDGVADGRDRCPTVPGPEEEAGCPAPVPGDRPACLAPEGGPDPVSCTWDAEREAWRCGGSEVPVYCAWNAEGCLWACSEPDTDRDGDGVPDHRDSCPDTSGDLRDSPLPMGTGNGCPDQDHDRVADPLDMCPTVPGNSAEDAPRLGCPDVLGPAEDRDHDGIPNDRDACPEDPGIGGRYAGCPPPPGADTDGDGIPDAWDFCPDVPGGLWWPPEYRGCPAETVATCPAPEGHPEARWDTDGDGLPDACDPDDDNDGWNDLVDLCPYIPAAGIAGASGCHPMLPGEDDFDLDGIPNRVDRCPLTPGPAAERGCPEDGTYDTAADTDRDGVSNRVDLCPHTPAPEPAEAMLGCRTLHPDDRDGDDIPDVLDACPETPGVWVNRGCPFDLPPGGVPGLDPNLCRTLPGLCDRLGGLVGDDDGDGVRNVLDACPRVPGIPGLYGCPDDRVAQEICLRFPLGERCFRVWDVPELPASRLDFRWQALRASGRYDGILCYGYWRAGGVEDALRFEIPHPESGPVTPGGYYLWPLPALIEGPVALPPGTSVTLRLECEGRFSFGFIRTLVPLGVLEQELTPDMATGPERVLVFSSSGSWDAFAIEVGICRERCE